MSMDNKKSKTENFGTRNVKLITFLVCMTIFLGLAGPWSVFRIAEKIRDNRTPQITQADVIRLSQKDKLTLADFTSFKGDRGSGESGESYTIQFGKYLLVALDPKEDTLPFYCNLTNMDTGDSIDIRKDDVAAFFALQERNQNK